MESPDPFNKNPWQLVLRFDGVGRLGNPRHYNKVTGQRVLEPHVHDPSTPGGMRSPNPDELPAGYCE
jgi:hypothetical protein